MRARIIQTSYKNYLSKIGEDEESRTQRRLQTWMYFRCAAIFETIRGRGKGKLRAFLLTYSRRFVLKVKIMRYFIRIESIQRKFQAYHANSGNRYEILQHAYQQVKALRAGKGKPKKTEKSGGKWPRPNQWSEITPLRAEQVLKRYLRFCKD